FSAANGNQNGLNGAIQAAFDGQRVVVTSGGGLSLFKAADLSIIGNPKIGGTNAPYGVCSDGTYFWVALPMAQAVGRF
ncbi:MAG TPA: hypothetical protein VG777_05830, partial [Thermoanaerobaculia bacterium]|nr:hypothetical protein [Thermoanaerobaculia bacterium]